MLNVRRMVSGRVQRFKRPAYNGRNRCLKCTVLNTGLAFVVATIVANVSLPAAIIFIAMSVLSIAYRGYLVPGMPTLVEKFEHWLDAVIRSLWAQEAGSYDLEATATETDVATGCPVIDNRRLTDSYRNAWQARMEELRSEDTKRTQLARTLSVHPEDISFGDRDPGFTVCIDGASAGTWDSRAAFCADLASEELLADWIDDWESLSANDHTQLVASVRAFVETCPGCGGEVVAETGVVRSGYREEHLSVTSTCTDCDVVIFDGVVA